MNDLFHVVSLEEAQRNEESLPSLHIKLIFQIEKTYIYRRSINSCKEQHQNATSVPNIQYKFCLSHSYVCVS